MSWKTVHYLWQWQLKSTPAELWPYVADTQRFNQATRLPYINFSEEPLPYGGSRRISQTSKFGISVTYEDYPFEWVREQWFSNLREFKHGPLKRTLAHVSLEANASGTLLSYKIEVTPANLLGFLGIPYQFGWEMRRNFGRVFLQIDNALQSSSDQPYPLKPQPLNSVAQSRLDNLTRQLSQQGHDSRWVELLANLLANEANQELARLRPYVLADSWQAPRRAILEMFLSAAKLSLLNMRWDLMCPLCRGAKETSSTLDGVKKGVHCPTCNIDFEADFTKNVELTFTPHPQVLYIPDNAYCIGGPMITPHILIHQIIAPGQTRTLPHVKLEPDKYRLRTQQQGVESWLKLPAQAESLVVEADTGTLQAVIQPAVEPAANDNNDAMDLTITLTNHAAFAQQIYIDRASWYTDAVTAAQVTTLQHFRDLFSDAVLRPGEEIGVQGMTILFSDLVGSTALYNRWGDAPSYALVREQFAFLQRIVREHNGAIVKTIGDAIMAAFAEPADGVIAALAIQREIAEFNTKNPDPLTIKLGLHHGPCIAVTLNGRLDYFGTTVNLAARLEGQSSGGDVVISERLRQDPAIEALLTNQAVDVTPFETSIKGFDEHFRLYRLVLGGELMG